MLSEFEFDKDDEGEVTLGEVKFRSRPDFVGKPPPGSLDSLFPFVLLSFHEPELQLTKFQPPKPKFEPHVVQVIILLFDFLVGVGGSALSEPANADDAKRGDFVLFERVRERERDRRLDVDRIEPALDRGERGVREASDEHALHPVVETLQADDGRILPLSDPNVRSRVIWRRHRP